MSPRRVALGVGLTACVLAVPASAGSPGGLVAFLSTRGFPHATSYDAGVFTMNPDGSGVRRIMRLRLGIVRGISWSPDGTKLAVSTPAVASALALNDIGVVDLHGHVTWVTHEHGHTFNTDPAWSPDGSLIAFASNRGGESRGWRIFTVHPDGTDLKQVSPQRTIGPAKNSPFDRNPTWSPDGTKIAFSCDGVSLCIEDLATGMLTTRIAWPARHPAWSPDGTTIAFDRADSGANGDLFEVNAAGGGLRRLTNTPLIGEIEPTWSPDGSTLAYKRTVRGHEDIWSMRVDGTHQRALAPAPGWDDDPAWSR